MFDRQTLSSFSFTAAIAVSTVCWLLLGYDSVGDPSFDTNIAVLLQVSTVLVLFASIWFTFEGNSSDHSGRNMIIGSVLGGTLVLGWMFFIAWDSMPGILPVFLVFLLPMMIMYIIQLVLSVIFMIIGFWLGSYSRKVMRRHFT